MNILEAIELLFRDTITGQIRNIEKLPESGSDRQYFRIYCNNAPFETCIATFNNNIKENETFLYFTNTFQSIKAPVPAIYAVNATKEIYFQQDFGNTSLLHITEKKKDEATFSLYKKSLEALAHLQINGDRVTDYNKCITSKSFGKSAILSDLLYFKYYFLDTLKLPYDKELLMDDFERLSSYLEETGQKYFMFRDFQARNIMVQHDKPYFIDYQGGMKGALQYDVASLLWQAKANLSNEWKEKLLTYYIDCLEDITKEDINRTLFINQYNGYVLIRLLQVLGAYGFRGLFEKKAHFLSSIPLALQNLITFTQQNQFNLNLPEFNRLISIVCGEEILNRFVIIRASTHTPLIIYINSFSFLQRGYPTDNSEHGGGFVFDCRGILNPGRIEAYKSQTGRDKEVIAYLEQETKMNEFLTNIFNIVDITVEDYIKRNFERLTVNFGCTGGRHRSVYAADALARHLRNKFGVKIKISHLEQNIYEERL